MGRSHVRAGNCLSLKNLPSAQDRDSHHTGLHVQLDIYLSGCVLFLLLCVRSWPGGGCARGACLPADPAPSQRSVLRRSYSILLQLRHTELRLEAMQRQAESASRVASQLMKDGGAKDAGKDGEEDAGDSRRVQEAEAEIKRLRAQLAECRESEAALKDQVESYDALMLGDLKKKD